MKYIIAFLLVLGIVQRISAQHNFPLFYDTIVTNGEVLLNGNAFYHASDIENRITNRLIFGGEITEDMIDESYSMESTFQSIGGKAAVDLSFFSPWSFSEKRNHLKWYFNLGSYNQLAANYSNGLYELAFYGNDHPKGKSMNLASNSGFFVAYDKIGAGLYNEKTRSAFSLNVIGIRNFTAASSGRGYFNTGTNGEYIDLQLDGSFTQNNSKTFYNGVGLTIDFDYYLHIQDNSLLNGFVQFSGKNIGFAVANKADFTSVRIEEYFQGFTFEELFNIFGDGANLEEDFKAAIGYENRKSSPVFLMPGYIQIGKVVDNIYNDKFQPFFGLRAYTTMGYKPMVYLGGNYNFTDFFHLGAQASIGGFGGFRTGLYTGLKKEQYQLNIGTEDVLGFLTESSFGKSLLLQFRWFL